MFGAFGRGVFIWACFSFASAAWAQRSEDEAGDVSEVDKDRTGPLRERVSPVSGHFFLKKGRFEFSPGLSVSARDAFYTKYIIGASMTYFPLETLGIGLRGGYSIPVVSGAAQICETSAEGGLAGCRIPSDAELDSRAQGKITLTGGLDVQWAPIYGKISLMAESFVGFDMYAVLGASLVQYRGPQGDAMTVGGNVGVGMRFFLNRWLTFRTELRDLIYSEETSTNPSLRNQILIDFGLSVFLPFDFKEAKR